MHSTILVGKYGVGKTHLPFSAVSLNPTTSNNRENFRLFISHFTIMASQVIEQFSLPFLLFPINQDHDEVCTLPVRIKTYLPADRIKKREVGEHLSPIRV
jgi:hypothetical protein